jgi:hypothetical protein
MYKYALLLAFTACLWDGSTLAQNGPCASESSKLACAVPQGLNPSGRPFFKGAGSHGDEFKVGSEDFAATFTPLSQSIGRQANLLPIASPSSGIVLVYDPSIKTFVASTDSLGPILGERAETVGRHHLFVGFSYQFFNFDNLDGVNLHNFPAVITHIDDSENNTPAGGKPVTCSINTTANLNGCSFVRDRIETVNSISLKVNQYTSYVTYGLTKRIDASMVIPIENVRMSLRSQSTIVPGTSGFVAVTPGSPNATEPNQNKTDKNGPPYFFICGKTARIRAL